MYSPSMNTLPPIAEMEGAYLNRDPAYNGLFFVGVRTTAIFCRPTCPARSPLPKNVEYFPTAAAALFAGYRPCKRYPPRRSTGLGGETDRGRGTRPGVADHGR